MAFSPTSFRVDIDTSPMLLTAAVLVLIASIRSQLTQSAFASLLSCVVNAILVRLYRIQHIDNGDFLPSLPYVFPNGQGSVEKFLQGRANSALWEIKYGGLYRLWAGMRGEVVLTKAAHVEAVFRDSHAHTKAHASGMGYLMDCLLGSCLGLISGSSWNTLKTKVEAPFLHPAVSIYAADLQNFTEKYLHELETNTSKPSQEGCLHPVQDLKVLPFLFVARLLYGPLDAELQKELVEMIPLREKLFKSVIAGGITRFNLARLLPFPLPAMRTLKSFKDRWAKWNDKAHLHATQLAPDQQHHQKAPPIVEMYKSAEEGAIPREQLLQTLDEMLFANIDVTMGGVSWTLVFLAAYPSVQKALREEIRAHSPPSSGSSARDTYLLSSWTSKPTLLGACILEASRLRPLAAFSVPQSCPTDRVLDGYRVPAGTDFVVDAYALNIRDPFWGTDREKFRPRRWLERHHQSSSGGGGARDLRYRYWRFGFGPRTCLGKYVVELVTRSIVVNLLEGWELSLDFKTTGQQSEKPRTDGGAVEVDEEDMDWPWDDEMWIHHPDVLLRRKPLKGQSQVHEFATNC
ncbi:hypothetical protein PG991_013275 [Apiospora marii]|uniref:Cytochrome P450 monooxygenase n=1 Tax=Apiospora marii TaxID=335849 RepID=A0ABR1R5W5_9PEZI